MSDSGSFLGKFSGCALCVLRIIVGILFMSHGGQKLFNYPPGHATVDLHSLMGLSAILELVGGAFMLVGFLTRPVAFILCGEMAVAYFKVHYPQRFWPINNGGELAVVYCFVFLYFVAAGGGCLSIDSLWKRGKGQGK
jgi:putative oxidoreductase